MGSVRIPILLWPDTAGGITGVVIGDSAAAAYGATDAEVLEQLRQLLVWRQTEAPWGFDPDILEPRIAEYRVDLRTQYASEDESRIAPCPENLPFRIPCVIGTQENGLNVCVVPHLDLRFTYDNAGELRSLVQHYVGDSLRGMTPLDLARFLPPRETTLAEITVPQEPRERSVPFTERPEYKELTTIADPLLGDRARTHFTAAFGRETEAAQLASLLLADRGSLLLVGEPGCGKTTLLRDAVKRALREEGNPADNDAASSGVTSGLLRYWSTSGSRIVSGMAYLGQWEERCEAVIQQLSSFNGVLCMERLLELIHIGGEGPGDGVGAFLLPYLQRGELRLIAEASSQELDACRRFLPALLDVFQIVPVPTLDSSTCSTVLGDVAEIHARNAAVEFPRECAALVHHLFARFQPYVTLPGPAIDFVRALLHRHTPKPGTRAPGEATRSLTPEHVLTAFAQRTGLPEFLLRDDQPLDLARVRSHFEARILGQPAAVASAVRIVASIKAGLTDPGRPCAVQLFCGPTGVGKTAMAQAIAEYCFGAAGARDRLVRLDLSEYAAPFSARRLIQGPDGQPAEWLQSVRRQPFCVVLLDEIEKAAPEVFDVLLGVLDEGRITDPFGRTTFFRSAIILLTSNLGSSNTSRLGFGADAGPDYGAEVQRFFRPEFFNRLDSVVPFNSLTTEDVRRIVQKEFRDLSLREGLSSSGCTLSWDAELETAVATAGYDHRLGTRPLQRALERMVVVPLARWFLAQPPPPGSQVHLSLDAAGMVTIRVVGKSTA